MLRREERQPTIESLATNGNRTIPIRVQEEWNASGVTLLRMFQVVRRVHGASVLPVGMEAVMNLSRHTPIVRGDSLYRKGKGI